MLTMELNKYLRSASLLLIAAILLWRCSMVKRSDILLYLFFKRLLPLQGARRIALIPRVLPWARSFWAFSPYLNHMQN